MDMPYTEAFKQQMVKRMLGPPGISATALSREVEVSQAQLSRWLARARNVAATMASTPSDPKSQGPEQPQQRTTTWTPAEKLRVLVAAQGLEGEALGALLRREGLHAAQLEEWRHALEATGGKLTAAERRRLAVSEKRVRELEKELRRKEKALAEAGALLFLEKKLQALGWDEEKPEADEDDAPDKRRGK